MKLIQKYQPAGTVVSELVGALFLTFALGVGAGYLACLQTHSDRQHEPAAATATPALALKAGDCFVHNGQLEPWEPWVEGQVMAVGNRRYLIMSSDARLKARYDGRYQGVEVDKQRFEQIVHKVDCPKSWRKR